MISNITVTKNGFELYQKSNSRLKIFFSEEFEVIVNHVSKCALNKSLMVVEFCLIYDFFLVLTEEISITISWTTFLSETAFAARRTHIGIITLLWSTVTSTPTKLTFTLVSIGRSHAYYTTSSISTITVGF